jgi:hypothetical protein
MANVKGVKAYLGHQFSSGCTIGEDFKSFAKELRSYIKAVCKEFQFEMTKFNTGHYDCSGYVTHIPSGRIVYWVIRDVRTGFNTWYDKAMCRSVSSIQDTQGGMQHNCCLEALGEEMMKVADPEKKWSRSAIMAVGNEIASLWGASCYGFRYDHPNKCVVFECIEHGEHFVTSQAYSEF